MQSLRAAQVIVVATAGFPSDRGRDRSMLRLACTAVTTSQVG